MSDLVVIKIFQVFCNHLFSSWFIKKNVVVEFAIAMELKNYFVSCKTSMTCVSEVPLSIFKYNLFYKAQSFLYLKLLFHK